MNKIYIYDEIISILIKQEKYEDALKNNYQCNRTYSDYFKVEFYS